jgi:hypothetical protein
MSTKKTIGRCLILMLSLVVGLKRVSVNRNTSLSLQNEVEEDWVNLLRVIPSRYMNTLEHCRIFNTRPIAYSTSIAVQITIKLSRTLSGTWKQYSLTSGAQRLLGATSGQ